MELELEFICTYLTLQLKLTLSLPFWLFHLILQSLECFHNMGDAYITNTIQVSFLVCSEWLFSTIGYGWILI